MTPLFAVAILAVTLPQARSPTAKPLRTSTITGRVVDASSSTPVVGGQVSLTQIFKAGSADPPVMTSTGTLTNSDGQFTFAGLEPGEYHIELEKPGFARADAPALKRIYVGAGERRELPDVLLARAAVIAGRVLGPSGEPLAEVRVLVLRRNPSPDGPNAATLIPADLFADARTDDLGEFRLATLQPGSYFILASPQRNIIVGSHSALIMPTYYPDTTSQDAASPISVGAAQTYSNVVIQLVAAPVFTVSGSVVDESGRPLAGASVHLDPTRTSSRVAFSGPLPRTVRTDSSGTFSILDVPAGSYSVIAAKAYVRALPAGGSDYDRALPNVEGGVVSSDGTSYEFTNGNGSKTEFWFDPANMVDVTVLDTNLSDVRVIAAGKR